MSGAAIEPEPPPTLESGEAPPEATGEPSAPSIYERSLDALATTLARRTRRYRNLVVCTVGLVPLAIAVSVFSRVSGSLVAVVLAVAGCSLFAVLDARAVARWRQGVLDDWVAGTLDLSAFASMIRAMDALPSTTTEAMLASLPTIDDAPVTRAASAVTRHVVARVSRQLDGVERHTLTLRVAGITTATLSLAVAAAPVFAGTTERLPAALLAAVVSVLGTASLSRLRAFLAERRVVRTVETARRDAGFERARFAAAWTGTVRRSFLAGNGERLHAFLTDDPT